MSEDIEQALRLQQQLRSILESRKGGEKDLHTLQLIRQLCLQVSNSVADVVCRDRLGQVENLADALFADRKDQEWAKKRKVGVLSLRHRAYAALDELERRLHYVMIARKHDAIRRECNATVRAQSTVPGSRS